MKEDLIEDNTYKIPIKLDSYEGLFNELDYREIDKRELNDDLNSLIDSSIFKSNKKLSNIAIELVIYIPKTIKDEKKEIMVKNGIKNYYKSTIIYQKRIMILGMKRISYYILSSLVLFTCWYMVLKYYGEGIITAMLNAGATVLLWEIMSLVLIERKNAKDRAIIDKKLSNMKIAFKYI